MQPVEIRQIVAAIDFSDWTAPVLEAAKQIADRYGASIASVHAELFLPPPYLTVKGMEQISGFTDTQLSDFLDVQREATRIHLKETVQRELGTRFAAHTSIIESYPAEGIVRTVEMFSADLIVMGTHGRRGFNRLLLGSVAENVVRTTKVPVLTIRGVGEDTAACRLPFRRILCPVNDTAVAHEALRYAVDFAEQFGADLLLMTSIEGDGQELDDAARLNVKKLCASVPAEAREHCAVKSVVREGEAAKQIIKVATEELSDLIVLGAQHRSFFEASVLGATSERVLRHAACPVLTVVGPRHQEG